MFTSMGDRTGVWDYAQWGGHSRKMSEGEQGQAGVGGRLWLLDRLRKLREREDQIFLVLTLIIGALTGWSVVAFILLTERMGMRLYPAGGAPWRRLLFPGRGLLGHRLPPVPLFPRGAGQWSAADQGRALCTRWPHYAAHRVGKVLLHVCNTGQRNSPWTRRAFCSGWCGDCFRAGATLRLRPEKVKALVPVGAAAAIAAAFNTPLAAVMFALEEIVGDLHAPVLGSVVLASATSWGVLRLILGNSPLFKVPQYQLVNPVEFAIYAVLGSGCRPGFGGLYETAAGHAGALPPFPAMDGVVSTCGGRLVGGLLGWFVPQVMGVGYGYVGLALNGNMTLKLMALLVVLKLMAVTTSYASGNAGGIFGPALFIGAMLGGSVGTVAHHFFPLYTATPGAYALVGMGAAFAGIVRAPMTSVVMIFEMTQDYAVIVPLMIANLVSLFISSRFQKQPLYEALAIQDGIHLPSAASRQRRLSRKVAPVMRAANCNAASRGTVREALELAARSESPNLVSC